MYDSSIFDVSVYDIKLFLLAEERNFSHVAAMTNMTQPTLSRRISQMETLLRMQLFVRSSRPVQLTPAACELYKGWKPLVEQFQSTVLAAESAVKSKEDTLSVCICDSGTGVFDLQDLARQMTAENPGIQFMFTYLPLASWQGRLQAGEFDIMITAIFEAQDLDDRFQYKQIGNSPVKAIMLAANPLAARESVKVADLKDQQFIIISPVEIPAYFQYVRGICLKQGGFEPQVCRRVANAHSLVSSLQNDNEVVIGDLFLRGVDNPHITSVDLRDTNSGSAVVWTKNNANKYIQPFIDLLERQTM